MYFDSSATGKHWGTVITWISTAIIKNWAIFAFWNIYYYITNLIKNFSNRSISNNKNYNLKSWNLMKDCIFSYGVKSTWQMYSVLQDTWVWQKQVCISLRLFQFGETMYQKWQNRYKKSVKIQEPLFFENGKIVPRKNQDVRKRDSDSIKIYATESVAYILML